ncbi:unnamed protein product [Parascedosporium putredinis]|uniref:Spindle pole body component n=1 Tax=Parascedosporium putredinis TaxID=1442378 RepID=A0A9P1GU92_9PEZI|nr:unnamed protein product [Parascedosporium putredinis]CAI7987480.1 unnamed protein product [Parascedosporium putredinis]
MFTRRSQTAQFTSYRERALRRLRNHGFLRTNQFEVEKTLNGLEETFRVHHREALADALRDGLDRLDPVPEKWRPDFLHLLLELSDRPLQNTSLDDLDALRQPAPEDGPQLRWEDIAKEDGWDDDPDLWASLQYDDSGSDIEQGYLSDTASDSHSSRSNQSEAEAPARVATDYITESRDDTTLEELQRAQEWRAYATTQPSTSQSPKPTVPELQVVREVLSMLRGQRTTMFSKDYEPNLVFQLANVSSDAPNLFECFRYYLRPMRLWMREGELIPGDKIFFVSESATHVPLNQVWKGQFRLRQTSDGALIVILKHLGKYTPVREDLGGENEPAFDFDSVISSASDLAPFTELFNDVFERWVRSKHQATAINLKRVLLESCGLSTDLEVLQQLYFMSDGSLAEVFSTSLFKKLDVLSAGCRDRYTLTSLAQEVYSPSIPHHRLSVAITQQGHGIPTSAARDFVRKLLPTISLSYNVRWPVQMILAEESISRYKAVYTLLLQLRRATYMLKKHRILANDTTDGDNWDDRSAYYLVRAKLLWFCNTFHSYLTTLVLAPNCAKLRLDLESSHDVDSMIEVHLAFTKQVMDECCLGSKLAPIREAILDLVDLTIQLEKAYVLNARRENEEMQEISRLSFITSPLVPQCEPHLRDDEAARAYPPDHYEIKTFRETVLTLHSAFDKHLRFVTEGLRAVARATGHSAGVKWDILAEMLESGTMGTRFQGWA